MKIALLLNENGFVIGRHHKPEKLDKNRSDIYFIDEKDMPSENTEPWEFVRHKVENDVLKSLVEITPVESVLTYKLKIQLKREGLFDTVVNAVKNDEEIQIAFNEAPEISRSSQALQSVAEQLELSDDQVDVIFAKASAIEL